MPIPRNMKKGQTVLYQGEVPSSVFLVVSGMVRALNISSNGEERTVALFGPGEYFPVERAFEKAPVSLFYYETMVDTELELFSNGEFSQFLDDEEADNEVIRTASQFVASLLHINALSQSHARDKVACIMQYLSLRFGEPTNKKDTQKLKIQLTQQDIARLCGLTRETTTIEVNKLKKIGAISVNKKYYTVNHRKITELLGNSEIDDVDI